MNIVQRTINNLKYAYYHRLSDIAIANMLKHEKDIDSTKWRKWAKIGVNAIEQCYKIALH